MARVVLWICSTCWKLRGNLTSEWLVESSGAATADRVCAHCGSRTTGQQDAGHFVEEQEWDRAVPGRQTAQQRRERTEKAFALVINHNGLESESHTPDFILGEFLANTLTAFDAATRARDKWYGPSKQAAWWEARAKELWDLLDAIDTVSDQLPGDVDMPTYRDRVNRLAERRHKILRTDGYILMPPDRGDAVEVDP